MPAWPRVMVRMGCTATPAENVQKELKINTHWLIAEKYIN